MRAALRRYFVGCALGFVAGMLLPHQSGFAIDLDYETEFLAGLRSRGLYRLAVYHAESLRKQGGISSAADVALTIELSKALAEWGLASTPIERDEHWLQAHTVLRESLERLPANSRRVLIQLQDGLLWLSEGDLAREEAIYAGDESALQLARNKLRTCVAMLESSAESIDKTLQEKRMARSTSNRDDDDLSIHELTSLSQNIALQTARALQSQAETYPAHSPDRINSLTRAVDQLTSLMQQIGDNELREEAALELVRCHRRLDHFAEAERLLNVLATQDLSTHARGKAASEQIRLLLAAGHFAEALSTAQQYRDEAVVDSADVDLAYLEALITGALRDSVRTDPAATIDSAVQLLSELGEHHGPLWRRRGEIVLTQLLVYAQRQFNTIQTARLAAEGLYRAGRTADAVRAYDRAVTLAREEGDDGAANDLAWTAAAAVLQSGEHLEAARRFFDIADQHEAQDRASEAHRTGLFAIVAALREDVAGKDHAELLKRYEALLENHVARWPDQPPAHQVRFWLAKWRLGQGSTAEAIAQARRIPSTSESFGDARLLIAQAYRRLLVDEQDAVSRTALVNEATRILQPVITGTENKWPETWTDLQRDIAVELARLQLSYAAGGAAYVERLVTVALSSAATAPDNWRHEAVALLLVARAVQGRLDQAATLLPELEGASTEVRLDVAARLSEQGLEAEDSVRQAVSQIGLRVLEGLPQAAATLTAPQQAGLQLARARLLAMTGERVSAIQAYQEIVRQQPDNAQVHQELAALFAAGPSQEDWRLGLRIYQQIESRSKPGGTTWIEARLARIRLLTMLDSKVEAEKLLKLTTTVHSHLNSSKWAAELEALQSAVSE